MKLILNMKYFYIYINYINSYILNIVYLYISIEILRYKIKNITLFIFQN